MRTKNKNAFTQAELLVAAAILGTLAAISIPRLMANPENAKSVACNANIVIINHLSDVYFNLHNKPATLDELVNNPEVFPDGPPKCPFGDPYIMGPRGHLVPHTHNPGQ